MKTQATGSAVTVTSEAARVEGIRAIGTTLNCHSDVIASAIADGSTIEEARTKLFEARAAEHDKSYHFTISNVNDQTFDNPAFRRDAMATALAAQHSSRVTVTAQAKGFMEHRPLEMAAALLEAQGQFVHRRGTSKERIGTLALHTSSDFPLLLADAANKMLLPEYAAAPASYRQICAPKTFADFKAHKVLRLGDFPTLIEVGEGGQVTRGTISENKESVTLATYARIISFSRQMLINDDLSAFADITMKAGRRVAMFENDLVFAELLADGVGPNLSDGNPLFDPAHSNFQTTGTPVNRIPNLSAGRAAMRKQTGLDGMKLNLSPSILLVGPDNETASEQVTMKAGAHRATAVNPFSGTLTPVVDANIPDYAWMLFASPAEAPVIVAGSLPGQNAPRIDTKEGWDVLGVEFRVIRDFGTGVVDYRGAYRDDGAAPDDEPVAE